MKNVFNQSTTVRRMTLMAVLIAIGTIASSILSFPIGPTKCAPLQSLVNVIAAVYVGPGDAGLIALIIGVLRNLLGTGTPFAFPGGIIGALLGGFLYRYFRRIEWAGVGEIIGTALIAAAVSVPFSAWILGTPAAFLAFFPGFAVSALVGGIAGILLVRSLQFAGIRPGSFQNSLQQADEKR